MVAQTQQQIENPAERARQFAKKLREETVAVRLRLQQFGRRRALTGEQVEKAAEVFGADASVVRGTKRILNDRCDQFRAVVNTIRLAREYWVCQTTPFPDAGVRLMKRDKLESFRAQMETFRGGLEQAVEALNGVYQELIAAAKEQLGELFNAGDYPTTLAGQWSIEVEYPSVEPPAYLRQVAPELYEQQAALIEARFAEAVSAAEQAFAAEFSKLVRGLIERLTPADVLLWTYEGPLPVELIPQIQEARTATEQAKADLDADPDSEAAFAAYGEASQQLKSLLLLQTLSGASDIEQRGKTVKWKPTGDGKSFTVSKKFDSEAAAAEWLTLLCCRQTGTMQERRKMTAASVGNLTEFFSKFKEMSIGSNAELDGLITKAQETIAGKDADALRDGPDSLRNDIKATMDEIAQRLDAMTVVAGGRNIDFEE